MTARLLAIPRRARAHRRVAWLLLVCLLLVLLASPSGGAAMPLRDSFLVTLISDTTPSTATNDGTIGAGEYVGSSTGINSGFGGVIGAGAQLHVDSSDAGALNFGLARGAGAFNDAMVIYIDTDQGGTGFATTSGFTDTGDGCRRAISGFDGANRATLNFAPGFTANYAICMDTSFAGLWQLGAPTHTFITSVNRTTVGTHYEMNLTLANLGLTPGASFNYVATYLNPTNVFRSDEFHGVLAFAGGNPGYVPVSLAAGDWNTFVAADVTLQVDQTIDTNAPAAQVCSDAAPNDCSLRGAISRSNAGGAGSLYTINVPAGTYVLTLTGANEDGNTTGDLDITRSVTLTGAGATSTVVNAGSVGDRLLHVTTAGPTVTLNTLTIRGGRTSGAGAQGAGLLNNGGTVTVNDSSFIDNRGTGTAGGGINNMNGGSLTVNRSTFALNIAGMGGGIASTGSGTLTIRQSTFERNNATQDGGAVLIGANTVATITNSTVSNNASNVNGGGVAVTATTANVTIRNTTIILNTADNDLNGSGNGGGFYKTGATVSLVNVILTLNLDVGGVAHHDCSSSAAFSVLYSLIEIPTGCNITPTATNITGMGAALGPLQDNGGPTLTHAPTASSPVIDVGDNLTCTAAPVAALDQRGVLRPFDGDFDGTFTCDMGAVEFVSYAPNAVLSQGDGPGGVGTRTGTSALHLWMRPDQGVYSDAGCTTAGSIGQPVGCWADQSGYGNHAAQVVVVNQPVLAGSGPNGQRRLMLDGNDYLATSTTGVLGSGSSYTKVAVANDVASSLGGYVLATDAAGDHALYYNAGVPTISHNNSDIVSGCCNVQGTNRILTARYEAAVSLAQLFVDGSLDGSNGIAPTYPDGGATEIGARYGGTQGLIGDVMEAITYNSALVATDRILVDNYLSSKFNLDISASGNDRYDGDTPGNGDFDLDVAGIGRTGGLSHILSGAAGLWVQDRTFLVDNEDWLLFGHRSPTNSLIAADLPVTGDWATAPNPARWERHWYIDVTDNAGTVGGRVDLVFDFSEGGFPSLTPGTANDYRLLRRTGISGAFSDITATCVQAVAETGDQVLFQAVDIACLGSNFTIGTLNNTTSPLLVMLDTLGATSLPEGVRVAWETALEVDNLGFHVLRATEPMAEPTLMTPALIPSQAPGGGQGASYEWLDSSAAVGTTYFYWLEALGSDGTITRYGPTSVTHTGATAVRLDALASRAAPAPLSWLLLGGAGLLVAALAGRRKR